MGSAEGGAAAVCRWCGRSRTSQKQRTPARTSHAVGSAQLSRCVGTPATALSRCPPRHPSFDHSGVKIEPWRIRLRITRLLIAAACAFVALEGSASAQAMFTGSIGNVFGGDAPSTKRTWAIAIGGGGAHGIGSELEFSQTRQFLRDARRRGARQDHHADAQHLRRGANQQAATLRDFWIRLHPAAPGFVGRRNIFRSLGRRHRVQRWRRASPSSSRDTPACEADLRRFKVRKADGISFQRLMIGIVLGG